jgi:hypothetical protein
MKERIMPVIIAALKRNPDGLIARELVSIIWNTKKLKRYHNIGSGRVAMWLKHNRNIRREWCKDAGVNSYRWVGDDA